MSFSLSLYNHLCCRNRRSISFWLFLCVVPSLYHTLWMLWSQSAISDGAVRTHPRRRRAGHRIIIAGCATNSFFVFFFLVSAPFQCHQCSDSPWEDDDNNDTHYNVDGRWRRKAKRWDQDVSFRSIRCCCCLSLINKMLCCCCFECNKWLCAASFFVWYLCICLVFDERVDVRGIWRMGTFNNKYFGRWRSSAGLWSFRSFYVLWQTVAGQWWKSGE